MQVIYKSKREVKMWSCGDFTVSVITYITKHRIFFFFFKYKIHQNNPKIQDCFYDEEYASNRRLQSIRNNEKQKANLWLAEYKQGNIINYEKDSN